MCDCICSLGHQNTLPGISHPESPPLFVVSSLCACVTFRTNDLSIHVKAGKLLVDVHWWQVQRKNKEYHKDLALGLVQSMTLPQGKQLCDFAKVADTFLMQSIYESL